MYLALIGWDSLEECNMTKYVTLLACALTFVLASYETAQAAYIDPNTGGLLFQLLAVLFTIGSGIVFFFSSRIRMALARMRRSQRDGDASSDESE